MVSSKESEKVASKDECSRVTFMEMSLSAGGEVQRPLALPNVIAAAYDSQYDKTM